MPHSVPTRRSSDLTVFEDNPWRSTRGRTITFASTFHLKPTPRGKTPAERRKSMALPYVKGMDDAELADWKTFDEVRAMRSSIRSEEHTSELQSLMRISYAVCCL